MTYSHTTTLDLRRHLSALVLGTAMIGITVIGAPVTAHAQRIADPNTHTAFVLRADSTLATRNVASRPTHGDSARMVQGGPLATPVALMRFTQETSNTLPPQDDNINAGQNVAMMVVGAAAVVTGVIIGGNGGGAIAVTGGVIGLVGLYRYLR